MKVHPYLHLIQSAFGTYRYTCASLTPDSTASLKALNGLASDSKTVMIANTRRASEAWGSYYRPKKGPWSVCMPLYDWLVGWLVSWQCISTTSAVAAITAPHNNRWLGS